LKFSKRCRAVPLRPIWTIMVAAKLDHSRVHVTKFHQNRSTLKGRSAGQRDTHTRRLVFTARLRPRSECPQFGMSAERRAQLRVPNVPRSRISERAPFRIYEHAHVEFLSVRLCSAPISYLAGSKWGRPLCTTIGACSEHALLAAGA